MKVYLALWVPDDPLLWSVSFLGAFGSIEKAEAACYKNQKNHGFEEHGVEPKRKIEQYRIVDSEVDMEDGSESNWLRLK